MPGPFPAPPPSQGKGPGNEVGSQNAGFVKRVHRNTQRCKLVATRWTNGLNVRNVLKSNLAVEYEGINIESTVVLVT